MSNIDFTKMVSVSGDEPVTDSKVVAEVFGKNHKEVLRDVRNILNDCSPDFAKRNFALVKESMTYTNSDGKEITKETNRTGLYKMTKDGFMLLAMGFTGKKAMQFKIAFINAFNWMAEQLEIFNKAKHEELMHIEELDKESFAKGSIAGRLLNERKQEKYYYNSERIRVSGKQLNFDFFPI